MLLILAFASDFSRLRFPFIVLGSSNIPQNMWTLTFISAGFSFPLIGFIIYASIDVLTDKQVAYFATFMMCWGTSAPSVLLSTWCK